MHCLSLDVPRLFRGVKVPQSRQTAVEINAEDWNRMRRTRKALVLLYISCNLSDTAELTQFIVRSKQFAFVVFAWPLQPQLYILMSSWVMERRREKEKCVFKSDRINWTSAITYIPRVTLNRPFLRPDNGEIAIGSIEKDPINVT